MPLNKRERIDLVENIIAGAVYAIRYAGSTEIERFDLEALRVLDGRPGVVLSWVPLEFRGA